MHGVVPSRLSTEDFVGRRAELLVFERAIDDARNGLPSVVLVGGDAGIGKTTTVSEAAARADVAVYLGRSTHIGGETIPLAPVADLLRQIRRSKPDLLTDMPQHAPLHHWFTTGTVTPGLAGLPQAGLFVAMLELISRLSADGVVLVGFEDLHWADTVTWDLFEYLARNLIDEQVVLTGTHRTNETGNSPSQRHRLAELSRLPAAQVIHLQGLSRDDVAERIAALIGEPAQAALVDQVVARGQGNPFFTRELVAAHLAGESIPLVLSDLITAEIAGLNDNARHVLGAIATLGRDSNHELLAATVELTNLELESAVRTVIDARLLVIDNDAYRFRHPLVGEVVYADLLPPQRLRLHRRIAETLRQQPSEVLRRADRAGELAFHLDRSGDINGAFLALLAAADAAQAVAPGAAFGHLERAFELWDAAGEHASTTSRAERLWQAAELATSTVGNKRAAELARAAFEIGPPPLGASWGHERLGRYLWSSGQLEEGNTEFARAAAMLSGDEGSEGAAVFAGLAQAELMAGRYATAEELCAKVFSLVPTPDHNRAAWVMARRVLGIALSSQGDPERGVEWCRESIGAAQDAQSRALAGLYLCVALIDAGDFQAAINTALDAVADGHLSGLDQGFGCYFDSLAAEALIRLGRWSEAATVTARHPVANTLPVGILRLARAHAMLAARRGETDRALAELAQADAQPVDGLHQSVLDATKADVHLALGNWDEAAQAADRGWESTYTTSVLWAARFTMFTVAAAVERTLDELARREPIYMTATVSRLQQRLDAARSLAGRLRECQRDTAAHLAHAAASVTRLTESDADAWADAAERWTDLGDQWMTATALLREAEAAAATGSADRAATSLRQAHAIASELGAVPLLVEVDAVSRRTRISVDAPTRVSLNESSVDRLGLTAREAEVLMLVAAGRTNRQIGEALFVSDKTASVHVSNILRKLGVNSRVDAAAVAQRLGVA
jgi:DNA-binding CsgD family transcriptional regulator